MSWHETPFGKVRDLGMLGRQTSLLDASLEPVCRRAESLTTYAWRFRYPGEPTDPTLEEAVAALGIAREVYDAILARLPEEVRP
ncbi:MAG: hypothetical protein ACE15E_04030 [Acidobacteriota bacterium]